MTGRAALLAGKLRHLVAGQAGAAERETVDFPGGAALIDGGTGWLLLDADPLTALGPVLVWSERRELTNVNLVLESDAGVMARRAGLFRHAPTVWEVEGTSLRLAVPQAMVPARIPEPAPDLAELLVDADLEVVVEDGIVRGEVLGLEVARIVHDTTTAGMPVDEPVLEVGVGHADRELTGMLHAGLPPAAQLARAIDIVRNHRRVGADPHPLNQLVPERWLRAALVVAPERVGLTELRPAPAALPRPNLRDPAIAVAVGRDGAGVDVVVACSVGIHLDLAPAAADARQALAPHARLLLAVPERDAHPVSRALADRLRAPAEIVPLHGDWRA